MGECEGEGEGERNEREREVWVYKGRKLSSVGLVATGHGSMRFTILRQGITAAGAAEGQCCRWIQSTGKKVRLTVRGILVIFKKF